MLSKKNRADKKAVEKIFQRGSSLNSESLTFKFIKTNDKQVKISFITPKSVSKLAVKRNKLRRHGYIALKEHLDYFPSGTVGVFVFKKYQDDVSTISNEIKNILSKIH